GGHETFTGADMSTKLKLLGVDVASFGDAFAAAPGARVVSLYDSAKSLYKKLVLDEDGKRLTGGMLVGDATGYANLLAIMQNGLPLPERREDLILPERAGGGGAGHGQHGIDGLPAAATICSCHNVSKGTICDAIRADNLTAVSAIKACTRAGSGCGSCV